MTAQRLKFAGVIALALVLLQGLSAVLLWQLVDDHATQPARAPERQVRPLPPLPPSQGGGSARAILQELEATTARLEDPLTSLKSQLGTLSQQFRFVPGLSPLLAQIGRNTSQFGAVPGQLRLLLAAARNLTQVRVALAVLVSEVGQLRTLTRSVGALDTRLAGIRTSVSSVDTTAKGIGRSFDRAVVILERMARDVARMRECVETPGLCSATPGPLGG